jgi:hypothetical protein
MSNRSRWVAAALVCFVCLFIGLGPRAASAAHPWFWATSIGAYRYGHGYGYGYGYPVAGGYDAVSGSRMAAAEMIRAQGQAVQAGSLGLEAQSRAAINYEQARSQYIENADQWTDVYNQRRRQQMELEAYERERHKADLQRYLKNRPDPAPPHTLSPGELNPSTGEIAWPETLLEEDYADLREAIEREYATHAAASGAAGNVRRIRELTGEMRDVLRANIREMPSYEYIAARKFIDGLSNSAVAL